MNKVCIKCDMDKPLTDFHKNKQNRDGLSHQCKKCKCEVAKQHRLANPERYKERAADYYQRNKSEVKRKTRNYSLKKKYGISGPDYDHILAEQNGLCAICKRKVACKGRDNLYVDHCHDTGKVRGLLCQKCNSALGLFNDNLRLLEEAVKYMRKAHNG